MRIRVDDMRDGYIAIINEVIGRGQPVSPRGQETREVLGATIVLENPLDALPVGINRKVSTSFAAVEALQLIAGVSNPERTIKINPNMAQFANMHKQTGRRYFHGAYGPRIDASITEAVCRIKEDKDTRQAVCTIFRSDQDLQSGLKDVPCTLSLHFMVRSGHLNLHVTMRSNDVWWGLAYDAFQFTQLQLTVANVLQIPAGVYYHTANSLHVYARDMEAINAMHPSTKVLPNYPHGLSGWTMQEAQNRGRLLLNSSVKPEGIGIDPSAEWYWSQTHAE